MGSGGARHFVLLFADFEWNARESRCRRRHRRRRHCRLEDFENAASLGSLSQIAGV